jgi:hypothetical protein
VRPGFSLPDRENTGKNRIGVDLSEENFIYIIYLYEASDAFRTP